MALSVLRSMISRKFFSEGFLLASDDEKFRRVLQFLDFFYEEFVIDLLS